MSSNISTRWIEDNSKLLTDISDAIWRYAEEAYEENRSSQLLIELLEKEGFVVETNIAGMETAFKATWGKGKPRIGFLAEYDALPELSQEPVPYRKPQEGKTAGHGCGHNLLGTAAVGAAIGLKYQLEEEGKDGTVILFGCPAEEILMGKIRMAKEKVFDDLDVALTWHPGFVNMPMEIAFQAMNSVKFKFHGIPSHAAESPEEGRSALDAVELMNVGVNYLREHVVSDARMHYIITNGGDKPNIVPKNAEVWYFIRAPKRRQVDEIYERMKKIAQGAALMTETTVEIDLLTGCYEFLANDLLNKTLYESLEELQPPAWNEEELKFAQDIIDTFSEGQKDNQVSKFGNQELKDSLLDDRVSKPRYKLFPVGASTDVSDVSWIVPTGQIMTCCSPVGTAGHTWQMTASCGMSIGHKGMLYAAKTLALTGYKLIRDPKLLKAVVSEFEERKEGTDYIPIITD
ncbi:MAG TPA: amidohydrolase [Tepidimicrobium sp.]|nr:amidohydrolase [Tepidimicrobium sp.]